MFISFTDRLETYAMQNAKKYGQVQNLHGIYVYSLEEDQSFDLPPGAGLVAGDVIEFDVQDHTAINIRKITAPPANLARVSAEDEKVGVGGQYWWKSYWQLDSPSLAGGYIVQSIRWLTAPAPPEEKDTNGLKMYQEAWKVDAGVRFTQKYIKDVHEWQAAYRQLQQRNLRANAIVEMPEMPHDDEFAQEVPVKSPDGFIIIQASARFYEGLVLPQSFVPNNPHTLADALLSRVGENTQDLVAPSITNPSNANIRLDWKAGGKTQVKRS